MSEPGGGPRKVNWGLRVMAVSAGVFLLSVGLCAHGASSHSQDSTATFLGLGLICLAASVIGMVVGVVMAIVMGSKQ